MAARPASHAVLPSAGATEYLLEDVSTGRPILRAPAQVLELLGSGEHTMIACGHSHIPRFVQLPGGHAVLNPGIAPHASHAVLEDTERGWEASFHRVCYDHQAAAARARELGREDWACGFTTGWVSL